MLRQIVTALALLMLTSSAFAQTFDRPFDSTRRNTQQQYRPAPAKSYSPPAPGPIVKSYAGQIGVPPPPSAYTGTYSGTYGATSGNR